MDTKLLAKLFELKSEGIKLERDTKWYNYKYATLDQIQDKLSPVLEKLKLLIVHKIENEQLVTYIYDTETGESIHSGITMTTDKAQDRGSEITYYRRYNLLALLDLKTEDDDWKKAQDSKKSTYDKKNFGKTQLDVLKKDYEENPSKYKNMTLEQLLRNIEKNWYVSEDKQGWIEEFYNREIVKKYSK